MSEILKKANLKAIVAIALLIYILFLVLYLIATGKVQITGTLDAGTFAGFIITLATAALIRWLFGEEGSAGK